MSGFIQSGRFGGGVDPITDSFNRADSSTLGNTDTGQAWVQITSGGAWGISGNKAYVSTQAAQNVVVVDSGLSDCTIEYTQAVAGGDNGCAFRVVDDSNYLLINQNTVWKKVAGGFTSLGSWGTSADGDAMKIVLSGSTVEVWQNGTLKKSVTETFNQTATKHGFRCNNGASTGDERWDDLNIHT